MNWNTCGSKATDRAGGRVRDALVTANRRGWLVGLASAAVAPLIPAHGHDQEAPFPYKTLMDRLSERPTGPSSADNLMTNEDSIASVMDRLGEVPPGLAYLGVGPDQNFGMIAAARPALALILDFRRKNQWLHLMHKALVETSADRFAYLCRFWARNADIDAVAKSDTVRLMAEFERAEMEPTLLAEAQAEVRRFLEARGYRDEAEFEEVRKIQARLAGPGPRARFLALPMYPTIGRLVTEKSRSGRPGHWLAADSLFEVVKRLHQADAIVPVVADWAGDRAMKAVADQMNATKIRIGTVYVSDVEFFLFRNGLFGKYVANLARLPLHPRAVIVRTSTRAIDHPERVAGNSSTTIVRDLTGFIEAARSGRVRCWEDLFYG